MIRKLRSIKGHSFLEVMMALVISSIMIWAFYRVYVDGIVKFRKATSEHVMRQEGCMKLRYIESLIRASYEVSVFESNSPMRSRLICKIPDPEGMPYYELYADPVDGTLRINDSVRDKFGRRVLPQTRYDGGGYGDELYPYRVKEFYVRYADDDVLEPFNDVPSNTEAIVEVNIVLEDHEGYSLTLSTYASRFN